MLPREFNQYDLSDEKLKRVNMINTNSWLSLNQPPALEQNEIHLWRVDLEMPEEKINQLFEILNKDEQTRANRFHFPHDRAHFIVARGVLRKLLGEYIAVVPEQVQFNYNEFGKPFLLQKPTLQFNLSHAQNKALIAITAASAVGVDIEYVERDIDIDGIAQRFFSKHEHQQLQTLYSEEKRQAFFKGWVCKEAFLKALGMGLSYSLEKIEVNILPAQPAKIIAIDDKEQRLADWSLFDLTVFEGYQAALVVKDKQQAQILKQFTFTF
jgi:4'-phosphopantetheinyl transferase